MSDYHPKHASDPSSDEEGNGRGEEEEDDEEAEEEEEEEELAEWTELTPLADLEAMEDGPSTYMVGGYSACHHLGESIGQVKYKEDIVVVFPGMYTEAYPGATAGAPLTLNEARLGGLRIYSVPYARQYASGEKDGTAAGAIPPKYAAPSKRRVGPWFTWLTAAATATLLTQDDSSSGSGSGDNGNGGGGRDGVANPLKIAASRAVAAMDMRSSASAATVTTTTTTTSGASVFAPAVTATVVDAASYPIFTFPVSIVYTEDEVGSSSTSRVGGLPHYKQEAPEDDDDDAADAQDDSHGEGNHNSNDGNEDLEEGGGEDGSDAGAQAGTTAKSAAPRCELALTLAGCCLSGGITLGALTRATVAHCIVGTPQPPAASTAPLRIAVTAASLTEALVEHCVIFGGAAYGIYAFPRAALTLQSTLVEGHNTDAAQACGGGVGPSAAESRNAVAAAELPSSALERLERRRARAERLRAFQQRGGDVENGGGGSGEESGSGSGSPYIDVEDGVLPRFVVPQTASTCDVGIMCDDADVRLADCLISHVRLGLLLHGGCAGTKICGLDIRSCNEAGLYIYGLAGAAEVVRSCVRACGRACLLLIGPSSAEVAQAAAFPSSNVASSVDGDGEDESGGAHRPVLAQHPYLTENMLIGAVRVQGEVRSGAVVDNFVFLPKEEKTIVAAAAAQTLLSVDEAAQRGFTYVGVEGERVTARATGQVAAAA